MEAHCLPWVSRRTRTGKGMKVGGRVEVTRLGDSEKQTCSGRSLCRRVGQERATNTALLFVWAHVETKHVLREHAADHRFTTVLYFFEFEKKVVSRGLRNTMAGLHDTVYLYVHKLCLHHDFATCMMVIQFCPSPFSLPQISPWGCFSFGIACLGLEKSYGHFCEE